jgi:hypothetical protein
MSIELMEHELDTHNLGDGQFGRRSGLIGGLTTADKPFGDDSVVLGFRCLGPIRTKVDVPAGDSNDGLSGWTVFAI